MLMILLLSRICRIAREKNLRATGSIFILDSGFLLFINILNQIVLGLVKQKVMNISEILP